MRPPLRKKQMAARDSKTGESGACFNTAWSQASVCGSSAHPSRKNRSPSTIDTGSRPEQVDVLLFDVKPSDWTTGGVLWSEKNKTS